MAKKTKRNTYYIDEELHRKFDARMLGKSVRFVLPYRRRLIGIMIITVLAAACGLLPSLLNRVIVDSVLTQKGMLGLDYITLGISIMCLWLCFTAIEITFGYFRMRWLASVGQGIVRDMRKATFDNLQSLAFDYYDSRPGGKILVRVTNYLNDLANTFSSHIVVLVVDSMKIFMIFVCMALLDYRLTLVVLAVVVPLFFLVLLVRGKVTFWGRNLRNKESNRTAYIAENIQGTFVTKAFNRVDTNSEIYRDVCDQTFFCWLKMVKFNELFYPISDGFISIGVYAVYATTLFIATGVLPLGGGMSIGLIVSFVAYMGMFTQPINNIAVIIQQLSNATSNLERVFEVIETKATVADCEGAVTLPPIEGNVCFDNVTFGYEDNNPILQNLSLEVPSGKLIALVGATGGGKTTLVSLLTRFYDVDSGTITIDGMDISKVTLHSLRSQIGVMTQDSFIFSGTILDNIRYAKMDATEEDCIQAAKKVFAHDFISALPDGYRTKTLEQGQGLSNGQRQLLSLARVVLSDPRIVILDEATSNIDTQTESCIQRAFDSIFEGRTCFVIAHRLSTIRKADCILFIADRGIAECGTHDQLMSQKGRYYNLINSAKH